ncbi:uncharacterized protein LOC119996119 [Tripterygium wilfordii]|uniref:uncharacterized protein LOC119996119 n=1 Tax=Tripterygium wilfordii TaxID=458696 RepID=UPI0018F82A85|nr:uncharacterized protein LOC119996119 [Tripterygium wilfordii]
MSSDDSNDFATQLAALKAQMAEDKAAAKGESASVRAENIALRGKVEQLLAQLSTPPPTSQVRLNIGSMQSLDSPNPAETSCQPRSQSFNVPHLPLSVGEQSNAYHRDLPPPPTRSAMTTNAGLSYDKGLTDAQRLTEVETFLRRLPGVPVPIRKSLPDSYSDSPFSDRIVSVEMPKKFHLPNMRSFDGTSDPDDHMAQYRQRMLTLTVSRESREACMCKAFGCCLTGPALQWFINLPNASISSFAQLTDLFIEQFASSRRLPKASDDLYKIRRGSEESLRSYIGRFLAEKVLIPSCNVETTVTAFRKGLSPSDELYKELTKFPCTNMEDALARAWAQVKWDEDESNQQQPPAGRSVGHTGVGKDQCQDHRPRGSDRSRHDRRQYDRSRSASSSFRKPEYAFNIEPTEMISTLKSLGNKVQWPSKMRSPADRRDSSKWCDFHQDHGHTTRDCRGLHDEVIELLNRGHLKDMLTAKGKETMARRIDRELTPPTHPKPKGSVGVIIGGSEISGISHSAAKRNARKAVNPILRSTELVVPPSGQMISFIDDEATQLLNPHHDALVISILVANYTIKRVLVDNGSSTNVLFLGCLKAMEIDESHIIGRSTILLGFSGEQVYSLGEIALPVYTEGINLNTNFVVLKGSSPYNIILGRPWIHEMKAIPSTYHQLIRFPTKWGVKEIRGEQLASRNCYTSALKGKTNDL